MTDETDPSRERDEIAEAKASQRGHDLANHVQKLTFDLESVKGGLSANTSITKQIVTRQQEMQQRQLEQSNGLERLEAATIEIVEWTKKKREVSAFARAWASATAKFAIAFSAFLNRAAKYWAPILAFIAAASAILNQNWQHLPGWVKWWK